MSNDTIILIGNGPSLNQVTDEFLDAYPTFGCNWIHKRMIPTYYSVFGYSLLNTPEKREAHRTAIKGAKVAYVSSWHSRHYLYPSVEALFPCNHYTYKPGEIGFSRDHRMGVYSFQTVLYINLQIIYSLGFRRVFIVGLDHDYGSPNRHFYEEDELTDLDIHDEMENDKRQRVADLAYVRAREEFEKDDREIINLTPNSKCTAFLRLWTEGT